MTKQTSSPLTTPPAAGIKPSVGRLRLLGKSPLLLLNGVLVLALFAGLAKPLASDWLAERMPTEMSRRTTAVSGFYDLSGFLGSLTGLIQQFADFLSPASEAPVAALEKQSAANKEIDQAGLNYQAALMTTEAAQGAVDELGIVGPEACAVMETTKQTMAAKSEEALLARSLSAANTRRNLDNTNSAAKMQELMARSYGDYCSPENLARGHCTNGVSPKSMPDGDINAIAVLSTSDSMSKKFSEDEYIAATQYVDWVTDAAPPERLPIAMEKTPAGQRYLLEMRRRQAVNSSAQYALNRVIASRWEKR